jgi:hypothetical protein
MDVMPPRNLIKDRAAVLAADLQSPRIVPAISKALEENEQEKLNLLDLRKMALRIHGEALVSPKPTYEGGAGRETETGDEAPPHVDQHSDQQVHDVTVAALAACYQSHEDSPYHKLRHQTRGNYDSMIRRILKQCGSEKLADWKAQNIQSLYDGWAAGGRIANGRAHMAMVRGLINFGATVLQDSQCERLQVVLHNMNFKVAEPRSQQMTTEQVARIISMAHEMGYHSVALAQAFQFDCKFRQKDTIGEWVPVSELGPPSDVTDNNEKWLRGIRWSEIDEDLVLRHITSWGGKLVELRLSDCPLVKTELRRIGALPGAGPVIVFEETNFPYRAHQFRRVWRSVADACGIPRHIRNTDVPDSTPNEAEVRKRVL